MGAPHAPAAIREYVVRTGFGAGDMARPLRAMAAAEQR